MTTETVQRSEPLKRWEGIGATAGIVAGLFLAADLVSLSASPAVGSSPSRIARYMAENETLTLVMSYLGTLTAVVLLAFIASLRSFVRTDAGEGEWSWTLTQLTGAVAAAVVIAGNAMRGAAAALAASDHAAVSALFHGAKVMLSFALVPIGAMVLVNTKAMSATNLVARWPITAGPWVGGLGILSGAAIVVHDGFFGPGEQFVALVALFLALWLAATGITMLLGEVKDGGLRSPPTAARSGAGRRG